MNDKTTTDALFHIANALNRLGVGDGTMQGAVEMHTIGMQKSAERIADALNNIAEAIREHAAAVSDD